MAPFKDYHMLQVYTHSQLEPHLWGSGTQQKNYFGTLAVSLKLNIYLLYSSAILHLHVYPEKREQM